MRPHSRRSLRRLPVPALATPGAEHAGAESLPGPRAVQGVVPAAVGLPGVVGAAVARAAGDDTTDRAELHLGIVNRLAGAVYSPAVLRPVGPRVRPPVRASRTADDATANAEALGRILDAEHRGNTGRVGPMGTSSRGALW